LEEYEIKNWEATRNLIANLCHFQNIFAEPMLLPFQLGPDLPQKLPVHRPQGVLEKFQVQDVSREPLPTVEWIGTLFELFEISLKFEEERKIVPRRLVACWYHIAAQLDYSTEPLDDADEFAETVGLLVGNQAKKFSESLLSLMNDDNYNSEEDSDYRPEEDEDDDYDDEDDVNNRSIQDTNSQKLSEKEQQMTSIIFPVVEGLGAYMPSPNDDLPWFKRCLKHIHFCQKIGVTSWYPWGCPPIAPLVENLKHPDPNVCTYAASILHLFKQSQDQLEKNTELPEDDDDTDYIPS